MEAARSNDPGGELQVTVCAPLALFDEVVKADAFAIEDVVGQMAPPKAGATVHVGGYSRYDCVQRAAATLAANGWTVTICERTTLPILDAAEHLAAPSS